jgi:mono/diheme cytochrome c family protein
MKSAIPLLLACTALLSGSSLAASTQPADPEGTAFFETSIRPLLLERCIECHGEKKQKGGLRLDSKAAWEKGGDSGTSLHPGDSENSLLIKAVRYTEKELQMPPKQQLSPQEVALLEKWVQMGAPDPRSGTLAGPPTPGSEAVTKHWAFQPLGPPPPPPPQPPPPSHNGQPNPTHPVDAFVGARLTTNGLAPNPAADARTLLRRVTLDLTGLPPTPKETQAFLQDTAPEAFERLVERLLASNAYGERWGRHWLDVARYADTAGDGADYPVREAGKYRDWVIQSFNSDQPYDQFLREQLAGDILAKNAPPEELAKLVTATGFLAVGKRYGYKPSPDFQHLDFADAIDSVGRSLLGLSLGCARCHDHKFDPVSVADYYGMYGIFQSTQWAFPGGEEQKRPSQFPALVAAPEAARLDALKAAQLAGLEEKLSQTKAERARAEGVVFGGGVGLGFEGQPTGKPPGPPWLSGGPNLILAEAQSPFAHVHPPGKQGVRIGSSLPNDGVRYVFSKPLRATPGKLLEFTVDFRTAPNDSNSGSYRFYLGRGVVQSLAVEVSVSASEVAVRNGTQWEVVRRIPPGQWNTLRLTLDPAGKTYSGIVGTPGDLSTFTGKALAAGWDGVADTFICDGHGHLKGGVPARDLDNLGLQEAPFGAPGTGPVTAPEQPADLAGLLKKLDADLAAITKDRDALAADTPYPVAYGVSEGKPTNARVHHRGEPEKLREEVPRKFLAVLGGDALRDPAAGSGRLDLADWITRPSNPLTARVFVNRVWQWHFGQGLVPTSSDFGLRGEPPSHPELLDWLTSEFMASGWSLKKLHRLVLHSAAYQRSSGDNPDNLAKDPSNQWLWRYSRRALDAESIRDGMLFVSGLLDRSVPAVHPFPPVQTWAYTIHRPFHEVYDSKHRSVYLMLQRNRRHPFLALFDAADPNASVAQRLPTTTPTQSLYLLNSPFVLEQARAFAKRLLAAPGDDPERIRLAFEAAHTRVPSAAETADLLAFLSAYNQRLAALPQPPAELQLTAWSGLARVLLTGNAFLYID